MFYASLYDLSSFTATLSFVLSSEPNDLILESNLLNTLLSDVFNNITSLFNLLSNVALFNFVKLSIDEFCLSTYVVIEVSKLSIFLFTFEILSVNSFFN